MLLGTKSISNEKADSYTDDTVINHENLKKRHICFHAQNVNPLLLCQYFFLKHITSVSLSYIRAQMCTADIMREGA